MGPDSQLPPLILFPRSPPLKRAACSCGPGWYVLLFQFCAEARAAAGASLWQRAYNLVKGKGTFTISLYADSAHLRYATININDRHAAAVTAGNKTVVSE